VRMSKGGILTVALMLCLMEVSCNALFCYACANCNGSNNGVIPCKGSCMNATVNMAHATGLYGLTKQAG